MTDGLTNLRRHLQIARLALQGDDAYQGALEAEQEHEWNATRAEQARLIRWAIDATNQLQHGA